MCVSGRVSERNNGVPLRPSTIAVEGVKRGPWKEEGGMDVRASVAFSFQQCVGRTMEAHRHAVPSLTGIKIHHLQCSRVRRERWGEGEGEGWTEDRFRLRRDKYGTGIVKEMWANLPVTQQCKWDLCNFSKHKWLRSLLPRKELRHHLHQLHPERIKAPPEVPFSHFRK